MKDKIFITGITGFIGENLKQYLSEEYEVIGVSRSTNRELISYEQLTPDTIKDAKAIIHLAGKAHDVENTSQEEEYYQANTQLTKKIFDCFLVSTCEVFIYASSVKAIADVLKEKLTENHKPIPKTPYGKSKLLAEEYIFKQETPEKKRVYVLRPCMVHGPNNKGNLNLLYTFINKGIPYPFGKYENKRSFLGIDNLCYVIKELINNDSVSSGIYNVSDDDSLSTKDLVVNIASTIEKKITILNVPKFVIFFLAKLGDFLPLPINSERVKKLTESYEVSNEKIKLALGIKQFPLSVKKGIKKTIKHIENSRI